MLSPKKRAHLTNATSVREVASETEESDVEINKESDKKRCTSSDIEKIDSSTSAKVTKRTEKRSDKCHGIVRQLSEDECKLP